MMYPTIYVLRHGETVWNAQERWQGRLNSPLTAKGKEQAKRQGQVLAGLDLSGFDIWVSPQGRAFQTAALALAEHVDYLHTDARLCEIDVGDWTGKFRSEMKPGLGPISDDTPDGPLGLYEHAPGGEGFTALRLRCEAFLKDLTRPTICVTHGITSRMLRVLALGLPAAQLGELPGGQGVVHVVENGEHKTLE